MSRDTIKFKLKKELENMCAYGKSKHEDKLKTQKERSRLKRSGEGYEEQMKVNYIKDRIYSYSTMNTYQKEISRFGDWLITRGYKKISVADAKVHIQEYLNYQESRGLSPDDYVFDRSEFKNDCDFHHMRELRAKDLYYRVLEDIKRNPARKTYYQDIIKDIFKGHKKRLREDFSKSFVVRGANKQRLKKAGRETEFDRTAVLFVSVTVLSHYRSDTTVEHYIGK